MQQTGDASSSRVSLNFAESTSRTHYILKGLDGIGLVGQKVDCLYASMTIYFSSVKITTP